MALDKCRECGTEVSNEAKVCPKCGISKPIKKTSLLAKIFLGLVVIGVIGNVIGGRSDSNGTTQSPAKPALSPKEEALASVKLDNMHWHKGGFDSIMMVNSSIKNSGTRDVKDIEIECTHFSNSETKIDSNKKVVYERVKAGKAINIKNFNMGFIHNQAKSTSCEITDLVVL